jgi:hypothetical protein
MNVMDQPPRYHNRLRSHVDCGNFFLLNPVFSYEIELIYVKFLHNFLKILGFKRALKEINPQKMLGWSIFKRQAATKMVGRSAATKMVRVPSC